MSGPVDFGLLLSQMGETLQAIPIGDYDVVVKTCEAKTTSNGKPMLNVKFAVEAGGPFSGRPIYNNFTISAESPNALRIFFTQMAAMGLDSAFFGGHPSMETVASSLVGRRARITVGHREWNGQQQLDVKSVKAPSGPQAAAPVATAGGAVLPGGAALPPAAAPPIAPPVQQPVAPPVAQPAPAAAPAYVQPPAPPAPPVAPPAPPAPPAPVAAAPVAPPASPVAPPAPPAPLAPPVAQAPTPPPPPAPVVAPAPVAAPVAAAPAPVAAPEPVAPPVPVTAQTVVPAAPPTVAF